MARLFAVLRVNTRRQYKRRTTLRIRYVAMAAAPPVLLPLLLQLKH